MNRNRPYKRVNTIAVYMSYKVTYGMAYLNYVSRCIFSASKFVISVLSIVNYCRLYTCTACIHVRPRAHLVFVRQNLKYIYICYFYVSFKIHLLHNDIAKFYWCCFNCFYLTHTMNENFL